VLSIRHSALAALLAALYFVAAKLSLPLAIPPGYATAVWPPSGIALAALLLLGPRLWPGVWLGAALVNATVELSWLAAAVIATGNTLEALAAAALIRRDVGVPTRFTRGEDVFAFIAWCALSAGIAASVGTLALSLRAPAALPDLALNWWTWWQGDVCGMVIVAPLILTWSVRGTVQWNGERIAEGCLLAALLLTVTQLIFGRAADPASPLAVPYLVLPLFVWVALRFSQREVTAAIAVVCALSVWHTLAGRGPFAAGSLNESLLALLLFICVALFMGLVLSAVLNERERALAQLSRRHAELRERFRVERERAEAELREAKNAAEKASAAKSEFLAKVSHELRTPLNSLLILAKLLADNADGALSGKHVQYARTIHEAGSDLLGLINDVLDLSKIESGAPLMLHFGNERFAALCDFAERSFRQLALHRGLRFEITLDPALPPAIETDVHRLRQILNNLLANAFKFTLQGGVTLRIHPAGAGQVAFEIADTGIGIPSDKRELVFEAFRQADGGTSRRFGGTGLGLSISRELARLLGGEIQLRDAAVGGAVFTLLLPLARAPQSAPTR
jgi:signal transduction histidine kinase